MVTRKILGSTALCLQTTHLRRAVYVISILYVYACEKLAYIYTYMCTYTYIHTLLGVYIQTRILRDTSILRHPQPRGLDLSRAAIQGRVHHQGWHDSSCGACAGTERSTWQALRGELALLNPVMRACGGCVYLVGLLKEVYVVSIRPVRVHTRGRANGFFCTYQCKHACIP
jgi:hypothetical protein